MDSGIQGGSLPDLAAARDLPDGPAACLGAGDLGAFAPRVGFFDFIDPHGTAWRCAEWVITAAHAGL
ncbi:MAG TPA: hypothetical protein DEO93_04855 [Stenotrophomonas sp.]|nr:hypothetical protein [Stenotrophomonas sp.]